MSTQNAAYNPTNGQPLLVGQNVTFNGITYTGTTPAPSGGGVDYTAADKLQGAGPFIGAPSAAQAVQANGGTISAPVSTSNANPLITPGMFQTMESMAAAGVRGAQNNGYVAFTINPDGSITSNGQPVTQASVSAQASAPTLPSTGNPAMDSAQSETAAAVASLYATGAIPTSLELTPANVARILSVAQAQTAPQTQQYINNEVNNLNANIQNLGNQFSNQEAQYIQDFGSTLASNQNSAGASGVAFSGQNNLNEQNLANTTNRNLASLSSAAEYNIGGALRTSAANVGSDNTNQFILPSLNGANVSLSGGQRGSSVASAPLSYDYNPTAYTVGSIPTSQATAAQNLANTYTQQYGTLAGNPSNSGRSVNDLLGEVPGLSGNTF